MENIIGKLRQKKGIFHFKQTLAELLYNGDLFYILNFSSLTAMMINIVSDEEDKKTKGSRPFFIRFYFITIWSRDVIRVICDNTNPNANKKQ